MADSKLENVRRVASGGRVNESETARKSREARERGERGRREAQQRGEKARASAVQRGEEVRRPAQRRGELIRQGPELRGALRRIGKQNQLSLTPPPQTNKQAETARNMQNASPLNRVLRAVDRLRGKQNQ